jgi:MinD-like ATPase involved in chromosome partitioning or flagellar assembly
MTEDQDLEQDEAMGRAAQDAAGALARMGIDPGAVGLQTPAPLPAPQPAWQPDLMPVSAGAIGPVSAGPLGPYPPSFHHPHQPTLREPEPSGGLAVPPPDRPPFRPVGRIVGRAAPMPTSSPPDPDATALRFSSPGTALRRPLEGAVPPLPTRPPGPDPAVLQAVAGPPRAHWGAMPGVSGMRQVARGAGKGIVAPSAAGSIQRERDLIARVRTRQREPRLTSFFSTVGGAGTTTTCAGVALALATVRGDQAALVDVQAGTRSLAARIAGRSSVSANDVIRAGTMAALPQPPATIGSLAVIDSAPWYSPAERGDLVEMLHQVRATYPFTVLDVGDEVSGTAHAMMSRADRLVIVQPAQPDLVDAVQYAMGRINQVDPERLRQLVVAVVGMTNRSYKTAVRRLGALLGEHQRVVLVPYDKALEGGGQISLAALRPATREAYLTLAAFAAERTDQL